jgi:hypothetical protein
MSVAVSSSAPVVFMYLAMRPAQWQALHGLRVLDRPEGPRPRLHLSAESVGRGMKDEG